MKSPGAEGHYNVDNPPVVGRLYARHVQFVEELGIGTGTARNVRVLHARRHHPADDLFWEPS